jgi:mxaL protein
MSIRTGARALLEADSRTILLSLVLLVVALVVPPFQLKHDTFEYIVIFDITQSMNVQDYQLDGEPASRLEYAREGARRALRELPCGSRVGWGAFAGYRTVLLLAPVEVCGNYGDLLSSLSKVTGAMRWENASEITKGVYWSMRAAKQLDSKPNVIFVTDGQEAPPLDSTNPLPMFDDLKPGQVHGWLIGAGGYAPLPIPKTDDDGNPQGFWHANEVMQPEEVNAGSAARAKEHLSGLREPHMLEIARQVGFEYARMSGTESLARAMLDRRFARHESALTDLYWIPASLALLLLAVRFSPLRWRVRRSGDSRYETHPSGAR